MWQKPVRKTLYTLVVDGFSPEITSLTLPLMKRYAQRIGAEFFVIDSRAFPDFPPSYEKLQIHRLAQERQDDWSIFFDADTLIHPETFDFTQFMTKDTVAHNGTDMAAVRWKYDRFLLRDGRHIGSCTWCIMASDWCVELWEPLSDMTRDEALASIYPTVDELTTVITPEHLLDDYTLSRNIAKYGLKVTTLVDIHTKAGFPNAGFFWHQYTIDRPTKVEQMKRTLVGWGIDKMNLYSPEIQRKLAEMRAVVEKERAEALRANP